MGRPRSIERWLWGPSWAALPTRTWGSCCDINPSHAQVWSGARTKRTRSRRVPQFGQGSANECAAFATAASRTGCAAAAHAVAAYAANSAGGVGHRPRTALGSGRGAQAAVERGGRWPRALGAGHSPYRGGLPNGEDVRHLGPGPLIHPSTYPDGAAHPGVDRSPREPGRVWTQRHRENVLL